MRVEDSLAPCALDFKPAYEMEAEVVSAGDAAGEARFAGYEGGEQNEQPAIVPYPAQA